MDNAIFLLPEIDLTEYGLGIIKPLKVHEVVKYGDSNLKDLLLPFVYKFLDETNEPLLFEYMLLDTEIHKKIISFLKILYRTEFVEQFFDDDKNFKLMIISKDINEAISKNPDDIEKYRDEIVVIDKNNFALLSEVICTSFFIFKPKEKEKQVIQVQKGNEAILEEFLRLQEQARQEEQERLKKSEKNLQQVITIVASQCLWNYEKVLNMTYYQFWNSYISSIQENQYKEYIQYKVSPKFEVKDSQKHWMDIVGKY